MYLTNTLLVFLTMYLTKFLIVYMMNLSTVIAHYVHDKILLHA